MKCAFVAVMLTLTLASGSTPVDQVTTLITELKAKVEADGTAEMAAYNKYACWCEATLLETSSDIKTGKASIEALQTEINKLGAEVASHLAEMKNLKKDIAQNLASQKEATQVRNNAHKTYSSEKGSAEESIGSMEAAIGTLTEGAKAKSKGKFLGGLQEAKVMSTLGSLRSVLSAPHLQISQDKLDLVRKFIDHPDDFLHPKSDAMAALQIAGPNPFGDYAPASTQIQGVLKGMYDGFMAELERDNVEEAQQQKAFEILMNTKAQEHKTLSATHDRQESDHASKTSDLADARSNLANTKEQLEADEKLFAQTKESCKEKAASWNERTRLRTEELQGMSAALNILTSAGAKNTFNHATTTLLQVRNTVQSWSTSARGQAFAQLKALAAKFHSASLAEVAVEVKMGGHFDKVIHMVQNGQLGLTSEEKEDVAHQDRCAQKEKEIKMAMEDLKFDIGKLDDQLDRMTSTEKELQAKIAKTEAGIKKSGNTIAEMNQQRKEENAAFVEALTHDNEAVRLLAAATQSLSNFYSDNGKKMTNLIQAKPPGTWKDEYGGQKSQSTGILAILGMIQEDTQREVTEGKAAEKTALNNFLSDRKVVEDVMDAQKKSKADSDRVLAVLQRKAAYRSSDKKDANTDLTGQKDLKQATDDDCSWIKTDLPKRQDARKLEMTGLKEAENFLKGINR